MDPVDTHMPSETNQSALLLFVSEVVAAQVSNKKVASAEIPPLIQCVYEVFHELSVAGMPAAKPVPAIPIKNAVTPDYIVCLEDGKQLKMLKRHLRVSYNMTPDQYRQRWALPASYPTVAPNYAKRRSKVAKALGLGKRPRGKRA
jgi:predicted transcriptional regulator